MFLLASRKLGDVQPPKDWMGKPLPTGSSKKEKTKRRRSYVIESLLFGAIFGIMDIILFVFGKDELSDLELVSSIFPSLKGVALIAVTAAISFAVMFTVSFVFEYMVKEGFQVPRYNRMVAELEVDEEE